MVTLYNLLWIMKVTLTSLPKTPKRNPSLWRTSTACLEKYLPFILLTWFYLYFPYPCTEPYKDGSLLSTYSLLCKRKLIVAHNRTGHQPKPRWSAKSSHFSLLQQVMHFAKMWLQFDSRMASYPTPFGFIKTSQQRRSVASAPVTAWELFVMNRRCVCSEQLSALERGASRIISELSWCLAPI